MRGLVLPCLLISACTSSGGEGSSAGNSKALMDRIEKSVRLPKGARRLNDYGRGYSYIAPGKVRAVYLNDSDWAAADQGCSVMVDDFKMRPCTAEEVTEFKQSDAQRRAGRIPVGTRRWFPDARYLPRISDGGCMQVTFEYDVASGRFLDVQCNGGV